MIKNVEMKAKRIWFEKERLYLESIDGRVMWQSLLYYRRLHEANEKERLNYELNHFGIHWIDVDEDVSYESFEYPNREPKGILRFLMLHPELNALSIARKIGIPDVEMALYLSGIENLPPERLSALENAVTEVGKELCEL